MLRQRDTKYVFVMLKIKYNFLLLRGQRHPNILIQSRKSREILDVDIHVSQQMMPDAFGDPLTFPVVISSGQHFGL